LYKILNFIMLNMKVKLSLKFLLNLKVIYCINNGKFKLIKLYK
jgi:hypothetical protein